MMSSSSEIALTTDYEKAHAQLAAFPFEMSPVFCSTTRFSYFGIDELYVIE